MSLPATVRRHTAEEYLALERAAEFKSEYIDGEIVARSGANRAHSLIATNLTGFLSQALRHGPCEAYGSDMRVKVADTDLYTYPDVTVVCAEPAFEDAMIDTLVNPTVIVEILSPSTEAYDRGEKFSRYRRLPSLQEYVLVAQDRPRVERYARRGHEWVLAEASGLDATVELTSLGCTLALAEVYDKVALQRR